MTKITLKKPIQAHGGELTWLTFREPDGADIMDAGYPAVMQTEGKKIQIKVDSEALGNMIARLADIPPSSVKKMHHSDFNAAAGVIAGFFTESLKEQFSTAISKLGGTIET